MSAIEFTTIVLLIFNAILILCLWLYILYDKGRSQEKEREKLREIRKLFENKRQTDARTISALKHRVDKLEGMLRTEEAENKVLNENVAGLNKVAQEYKELKGKLEQKGIQRLVDEKEGIL